MSFLYSTDEDPKRMARRPLLVFLLATLAVGAAANLFTEPNLGWYAALNGPSFAPPSWLLKPLWTLLYVLMAVAAWRVWKVTGVKSTAMALYALQLAFSFVWTALFFGPHRAGLAFSALLLLVLLAAATTVLFWRHDRWAGWLYLPSFLWAAFAAVLVALFQGLHT
jgi:translocator protein